MIRLSFSSASSAKASISEYRHLSESHLLHRNYEPGSSCCSTGVPTLIRLATRPAAEPVTGVFAAAAAWPDTRAMATEHLVLRHLAGGRPGYR